ncbi:MAG: thiamine pyrophosphate-dependent enzyme, partial [Gemmatimonas sp.]
TLLASSQYDASRDEPDLSALDWQQFTDDEFDLCPPIVAMGGDGAMLDIGFQNLSRLMASGKPIRVVVLDTQVYSNTGGQACTSGFTGQVSDMAAYGRAQHGKTEARKELALIAIAHRGAYVHQSSQASASHLISGVLRGLQKRRPAIFNIYTPCPVEHGLADDSGMRASRLALESRAFPYLTFDPDAGPLLSDALSLDGNPALDQRWPEYNLEYVDGAGQAQRLTLPLTIADWAATEGRFKKHFTSIPSEKWNEDMVPFHEFLDLDADGRDGKTPYILTIDAEKKLARLGVSPEIVTLAEERLQFFSQLKEIAGLEPSQTIRDRIIGDLEAAHERQITDLRAEYEAKLADLRATYPRAIAKRMADALLHGGAGKSITELLSATPIAPAPAANGNGNGRAKAAAAPVTATAAPVPVLVTAVAAAPTEPNVATVPPIHPSTVPPSEDDLAIDPHIESARCTSCNECTNLNGKLFGYNANKQATIKDPDAGTFQQLVVAAERCPVGIIHPGTPRNAKEKDLAKWQKRAEPFN